LSAASTVSKDLHADRWAALALVIAASALIAVGFLAGTPPDEEEFRYAVLTSWLHVRALSHGHYAFWTSLLGLGVPQPFIPNFWFHPLLPFLAVLEPSTWVRLVLLAHTVFGAAGMWRLGTMLGFRPMVRAICTATFLLAAPGMNYALSDAWPSHWIVWTSMPWLLLCLWRALESERRDQWRWSVLLGLSSGLVIANGNPAYCVVYAVIVVAVIVTKWRNIMQRWRPLGASALIVLLIAAPNAALLVSERGFFASGMRLQNDVRPLSVGAAAWDVFLRPLGRSGSVIALAPADGARNLFFGGSFALLALAACFRGGWNRRELVVGVAVGLALLFTTLGPIPLVSQRYQFRDLVILCAIPLAGMAAERGLQQRRVRKLMAVLMLLQIMVVALTASPFVLRAWEEGHSRTPWLGGATAAVPSADTLVSALAQPGLVALSPRVDSKVMNHTYLSAGLGVNGLAYRGVHVLNGWFKGVSTDPVWPDERLFYGRVAPPQLFFDSPAALDLLGVRYVLSERGESVARDLRARPLAIATAPELVLYENQDARTGAFLIEPDAADVQFPALPGCANDRLLCRDLSTVANLRFMPVAITRSDAAIDVTFDRRATPLTLVVAEMFRPAWTASIGDQRLPTFAFVDSLLAVRVPPGATSVHFAYRPLFLYAATFVAWTAILGSLITAVACRPLFSGAGAFRSRRSNAG